MKIDELYDIGEFSKKLVQIVAQFCRRFRFEHCAGDFPVFHDSTISKPQRRLYIAACHRDGRPAQRTERQMYKVMAKNYAGRWSDRGAARSFSAAKSLAMELVDRGFTVVSITDMQSGEDIVMTDSRRHEARAVRKR